MKNKKEVKVEDLNRALWHVSREARRRNKALKLDTLYEKDGFLVKESPTGSIEKIKKLPRSAVNGSPRVIPID